MARKAVPRRKKKSAQLQIRVTTDEKRAIRAAAQRAGTDVSSWVLERLLPSSRRLFEEVTVALAGAARPGYVAAELNDLLDHWNAAELEAAVGEPPGTALDRYWSNYVAALVETAAQRRGMRPPAWTGRVRPLDAPVFGSDLESLRLHLLTRSPPAFRRRNLFVDSSVGDRV